MDVEVKWGGNNFLKTGGDRRRNLSLCLCLNAAVKQ